MTEQEAIEVLREHKEIIDKKYFKARNSKAIEVVLNALKGKDNIIVSKDRLLSVLTIKQNENEKELEMLKDFKEIAESKVGELSPIRIKKNKSVIKQTMS